MFHQLPQSNVILVCDDDSYKKSLFNAIRSGVNNNKKKSQTQQISAGDGASSITSSSSPPSPDIIGDIDEATQQAEIDLADFQTNVLTQVIIELCQFFDFFGSMLNTFFSTTKLSGTYRARI